MSKCPCIKDGLPLFNCLMCEGTGVRRADVNMMSRKKKKKWQEKNKGESVSVFEQAWLFVKGGPSAPIDWNSSPDDLPLVSEAYKRVIRLLTALDVAMGWSPTDWSRLLKTDRDLLAHLEDGAHGPPIRGMAYLESEKYREGMRRTLAEYDRLKSMEGME